MFNLVVVVGLFDYYSNVQYSVDVLDVNLNVLLFVLSCMCHIFVGIS